MNKKARGYGYFTLVVFALLFGWQDDNGFCIGDKLLRMVGLKAWSNDEVNLGVHFTSFLTIALFILGYWGTVHYLKPFYPSIKKKIVLIVVILFLAVTPMLGNLVKKGYYTLNSGLNAVEYYERESSCRISRLDENKKVEVDCHLTFENYNKAPESFQIFWKEETFFLDGFLQLQNDKPNYIFTLDGGGRQFINVTFQMRDSSLKISKGESTRHTLVLKKQE